MTPTHNAYTLKLTRRKSIGYYVLANGTIEIRAPYGTSKRKIESGFQTYAPQLLAEQKRIQALHNRPIFILNDGANLPVYDHTYTLKLIYKAQTSKPSITQRDSCIYLTQPYPDLAVTRELIANYYKKIGKSILVKQVNAFATSMAVHYNRIMLKEQKTRWGSCSSLNNLNFNWKILLMPPPICDYIIVHELSHLKELNHSPAFWQIVENVLPDYQNRRTWLKKQGMAYQLF